MEEGQQHPGQDGVATLLTLTRMEGKLDTLLQLGNDHETRLRVLEKARWPLPALAILISIGSAVVTWLAAAKP